MIGLLLALALSSAHRAPAPLLPACQTDTDHVRWQLKTRRPPPHPWRIADHLSVARLLDWDVPTARRSDETIDVRERGLYKLTGYVRLAKISPDDCDLHVQLADHATGRGPQVIAEIPRTDVSLQLELAELVGGVSTTSRTYDGRDAIALTITGYAFVDQEHATRKPSKRGYSHGTAAVATLWEIHPVIRIERAR